MLHRLSRALLTTSITAATALTVALPARADEHDVARSDTPSGYAYSFGNDAVAGSGLDAQGGRIHAVRHAQRDILLRPRLSFVPELLKSVESL